MSTTRTIVVPPRWQGAYDFGYAPAIRTGDHVVLSGVPAGGPGTLADQIERMYRSIVELLTAAGATTDDVVELVSYHVGVAGTEAFSTQVAELLPVHRRWFGEHRPAWTAVAVTALLAPGAVIEMKATAVVGSGTSSRIAPTAD